MTSDSPTPRILPMGERGLLVEVSSVAEVQRLRARLAAGAPEGIVGLVPAARTVLVRIDPARIGRRAARDWIARVGGEDSDAETTAAPRPPIVLAIAYDGADLDATAALAGLSPEAFAAEHADARWEVAFTGFAPGFAYLVSAGWRHDVPRLESPRTRVPAGALGLAGEFSGAYPRDTPGGWRLIGRTDAVLFDPARAEPALLAPGDAVRFRRVRPELWGAGRSAPPAPPPAAGPARPAPPPPAAGPARPDGPRPVPANADRAPASAAAVPPGSPPALRVLSPGLLATVQDLGRPGRQAEGIAPSGALDRGALRLANRLVGNAEDAAAVEITMGGFAAVAERDLWFALAGADAPASLDGRPAPLYEATPWPRGARLEVGWASHGARVYLAVREGIEAPVVAGSRSTDRLAGIGLPPLATGDALATAHDAAGTIPAVDIAPWGAPALDAEVELAPGPREGWFTASAVRALFEAPWSVTRDADRVGMRLDGPELERSRGGELPSEGMVPGALQVPPSGRPTILLADGPVTGGYPVIAVVTDAGLDALAQLRPGGTIRFRHARPAH